MTSLLRATLQRTITASNRHMAAASVLNVWQLYFPYRHLVGILYPDHLCIHSLAGVRLDNPPPPPQKYAIHQRSTLVITWLGRYKSMYAIKHPSNSQDKVVLYMQIQASEKFLVEKKSFHIAPRLALLSSKRNNNRILRSI